MGLQCQTWLNSWTCNHFFKVETRSSIYNDWYLNIINLTIRKPMLRDMVLDLITQKLIARAGIRTCFSSKFLELLFFQSHVHLFLTSLRIKFPLLFYGCCSQRKTIFFNHPGQWETFTYFHTGPSNEVQITCPPSSHSSDFLTLR